MSTTQEEWTTKEETGGGLFLKIAPDTEARMRFVGKPIKRMEAFGDQPAKVRYYSRVIARTVVDGKPHSEPKVFGFGTMIKNGIADFALSEDWGDPSTFDIIVKRTGADKQTKYSLIPCPKKEVKPELLAEAMAIDLEAVTGQQADAAPVTPDEDDPYAD